MQTRANPGEIASEDDPRVAEILARREQIRAAKRARVVAGDPRGNLTTAELDAVAPSPLRRRRDGAARKCPDCGHKVNLFSGACHDCRSPRPRAADIVPVRAAARAETAAPPPGPKDPAPMTETDTPAPARNGVDRPEQTGTPCPDCGEPRNPVNNRCYRCRPGGMVKVDGRLVRNTPGPARGPHRPRRAKAAPTAAAALDPEIAAIQGCLDALAGLDAHQLGRVLKYVRERMED